MSKLNTDVKIGYAVAVADFVAVLITLLAPPGFIRFVAAVVITAAAVASRNLVKKRCILSHNKGQVLMLMSVIAPLFLVLYYLTGLHYGFATVSKGMSLEVFWKFVIPLSAIVVFSEIVRSVLLSQRGKVITVLLYGFSIGTEVLIAGGIRGLTTVYKLMDFMGMTLFPAITGTVLYNYLSKRYGAAPNLVLRLVLTLYLYFIPFVPNVSPVLPAFATTLLPVAVYIFISLLYEKRDKKAANRKSKWQYIYVSVSSILMIATVMLISCQFRFGVIVVATPSMTDAIKVGDAVIYEDYKHCDTPQENDVIVFTKDSNSKIVHRVVDIDVVEGQRRYITKGDANENNDSGYVTDAQIIGIVRSTVDYIGYPTVWLREMFK
ncbi:MAG: signal peptidase I [Clostridia bacterium]|nr:signal peptidase I [Clostridia bacterium]